MKLFLLLVLLGAGCALTHPELYGTAYMRREWNRRLTPTGRTAYEESKLCARWAYWQRIPSNYTPGTLLIADGDHWHCYLWPMKITRDPVPTQ